ncbi:MAG TPA: pYEATS domain-containing protein [Cyclobacteriaceae bacterium]|jgi:hypothetical protein|nr:pYEATS domain-containing protein [Cyclobacteriaceae bacterium]
MKYTLCEKPIEVTSNFPWDKLFPDILWIAFWLLLLLIFWKLIKGTTENLSNRLKHGSGVKIGSFELPGLKVSAGSEIQNQHFQTSKDDGVMDKIRSDLYKNLKCAMTVHKIFKSQKDGQLYDILIYQIPHKGSNLIQVVSVDYYFGHMWDKKVFTTTDRSNGFAIATSAYGPFLCLTKINFNDGQSTTEYRYIDFEMGDVAAMTKQKGEEK